MFGRSKLSRLSIPKPCHEDWDKMAGDARKKFCNSCRKNVHNLSALTRSEAELLVRDAGSSLCGRVAYDQRGKLFFRPEPQSWISKQFARLAFFGIAALETQAVASAQTAAPSGTEASRRTCGVDLLVSSPTGLPIWNSKVLLMPKTNGPVTLGDTNADGVFHTEIASGKYAVNVSAYNYGHYRSPEVDVSCQSETPLKIELRFDHQETEPMTGVISIRSTRFEAARGRAKYFLRRRFR